MTKWPAPTGAGKSAFLTEGPHCPGVVLKSSKFNLSDIQRDRAIGVLVGAAAGDALGAGYEFGGRVPPDHPVAMIGGGRGPFQPGEWTDDTSMAVAIAESLAARADLRYAKSLDAVVKRWHWWARNACDVDPQTWERPLPIPLIDDAACPSDQGRTSTVGEQSWSGRPHRATAMPSPHPSTAIALPPTTSAAAQMPAQRYALPGCTNHGMAAERTDLVKPTCNRQLRIEGGVRTLCPAMLRTPEAETRFQACRRRVGRSRGRGSRRCRCRSV
jgi:ADP-ribosylglycohydrolase